MTDHDKQRFMNQYQTWLKREFLSPEQRALFPDDWEGHFNRLSSMLANFIFCFHGLDELLLQDRESIVDAYGDYLTKSLDQRCIERGKTLSAEGLRKEHEYYHWPLRKFLAGWAVESKGN